MFPGFQDRFQKELTFLAISGYSDTNVDVIAQEDRRYSALKGGSILSSLCYSGKLCWLNLPRSFMYLFILYFTYIYFCVVTIILCLL